MSDQILNFLSDDLVAFISPDNIEDREGLLTSIRNQSDAWMNIFRNLQNNLTKIIDHFQLLHQTGRELSKQSKTHIVRLENYVKDLQTENHILDVDKRILEVVAAAFKESRDSIKVQRSIVIIDFFKFNDKNRTVLKHWIQLMKYKLKDNVDHFEVKNESKITRRNRMMYAYFRTEDVCQSQILSNMNSTNLHDILHIVENIIHFINKIYKNSNERNTTQKKIHQLRQRNRFFVKYFIEFQQYIEDTDYDAQAQLAHFNEELFYEIKNVLIIQSDMFLKQLIPHCQRIDNKFCSLNNTLFDKWVSIPIFSEKFKSSTFFTSTILFTLNFTISSASSVSSNDHHHDSMNLFVVIIDFRRFLIDVEKAYNRKHRRKNDLCLYCGENDHLLRNCSHKLKSQLRVINFIVSSSLITFISLSKIFDSKNI